MPDSIPPTLRPSGAGSLVRDVLVNLDVDDLGRAIRFYTEVFELRVGRWFGEQAVELLGAKVALYLLHKSAGSAAFAGAPGTAEGRNTRSYERHWTPVHLDFVVSDVEVALQRAEAAGARREGPVQEHSWGKLALLCDPWGHGFCLLQLLGRGYDEIANEQPANADAVTDPGAA
jgi:predicted enzyme related to lactoylglutathione lyase